MKAVGRKEKLLACIGVGVGLVGPTAAHADVHFNGFGQIVVGSTLDNNRPMPNRTNVYGYTADPDFRSESLFGLQAQASLSDQLSATAQILASGANESVDSSGNPTSNDFKPKFAWAYATWTFNDNWSLKGGRQRIPIYHYSDYLQVGEAYPWIRPPISVYTVPVNNYDGVSLNGNFSVGDWFLQPQVYYGGYSGSLVNLGNVASINLSNLVGAVFDASYSDWLEFRLGYTMAKLSADYPTIDNLKSGISQLAAEGPQIQGGIELLGNTVTPQPGNPTIFQVLEGAYQQSGGLVGITPADVAALQGFTQAQEPYGSVVNDLNIHNQTLSFSSAGFEINKYNFTLDGEYTYQKSPSFVNTVVSYYLSLAYHYQHLTPYLTYGRSRSRAGDTARVQDIQGDNQTAYGLESGAVAGYNNICAAVNAVLSSSCQTLSNGGLPNDLNAIVQTGSGAPGAADQLYGGVSYLLNAPNTIDDYYEAGLRYDVSRSTALKLDYTYYASPQSQTSALGDHPTQGFSHAQLLSAAFVFTF